MTEHTKPDNPATGDKTINVDLLQPGMRLAQDIHDQQNVLLMAAGTAVTKRFLELLRRRSIKVVRLAPKPSERNDPPPDARDTSDIDDSLTTALEKLYPVRHRTKVERPRLPVSDLRAEALRGLERHAAASKMLADTYARLHSGAHPRATGIRETSGQLAGLVSLDSDLPALLFSMQESREEYLFDHCVNVALISMSMAAQIGWNRDQMTELGMGALLQDIGMMKVPETIRLATRRLEPAELDEIQCHPYHTLNLIERIKGLPQTAIFIAYQSHERADRSGYPRQRSGSYLHAFSKIVAIADAYAAMTRGRPYRKALRPYEAAKNILVGGSANKFDRQFVRAFLDSLSLFPIGSFVELNDGTTAQVIRANPGHHTEPVVEELGPDGTQSGRIVDLSMESDLRVVRALDRSPTDQQPTIVLP